MRIYKYDLSNKYIYEQVINMPEGAKILSIHMQFNEPRIWALVDPKAPIKSYTILALMTGEYILNSDISNLSYIGTVLFFEGSFIVHYFLRL